MDLLVLFTWNRIWILINRVRVLLIILFVISGMITDVYSTLAERGKLGLPGIFFMSYMRAYVVYLVANWRAYVVYLVANWVIDLSSFTGDCSN